MLVLQSIVELETLGVPIVLAAGTFDGLHLGHQALVRRAMNEANRIGGIALVMTFDRHPASITRPENVPKLLTRNATKLALLEKMGVPVVLLLEFTPKLASIDAEDFIRSFPPSLHEICVGSKWSFGYRGAGNVTLLRQLGEELGFVVTSIEPVEIGGKPISSTRIREVIALGNFEEASCCLGRRFRLNGTVVTGAGLGTKMGFPTANLDVAGMQLPPCGVYAVKVFEGTETFNGVANIGRRPTVDPKASSLLNPTVEVHLFDVSKDFTGLELSVEFVQFLREEQKFSTVSALTEQISKDCEQALTILTHEAAIGGT